MNNPDLSKEKLDLLLSIAGRKLGSNPQDLKKQLENGAFDQAIKNLNPNQSAKINRVLSNPKEMEQLLNQPKVKELLNSLMKEK